MNIKVISLLSLVSLLLISVVLHANNIADKAIVVRLSNLKSKASFTAPTIKQVKLGYQVSIVSKQGAWVQVQGIQDASRGWLRSYQLRSNVSAKSLQLAQNKSSESNGLADLSRSTSALLGTSKKKKSGSSVVATIGIRGLSEQELKQAKPNPVEFKKMQSYASNKKLVAQFAQQTKLQVAK